MLVVMPAIGRGHIPGQASTFTIGADVDVVADRAVEPSADDILHAAANLNQHLRYSSIANDLLCTLDIGVSKCCVEVSISDEREIHANTRVDVHSSSLIMLVMLIILSRGCLSLIMGSLIVRVGLSGTTRKACDG